MCITAQPSVDQNPRTPSARVGLNLSQLSLRSSRKSSPQEPFHLDRYVTEQVFRYNNRATKDNPLTDADRFILAVSQISGKRLTYAELTGKVGETTV